MTNSSFEDKKLEILKTTVWTHSIVGSRAIAELRDALRIDNTPPPDVPRDRFADALDTWPLHSAMNTSPPKEPTFRVVLPAFDRRVHGAWTAVQILLISAANVSKLLGFPHPPNSVQARLRSILQVGDDSPISRRSLRNAFEHLDTHIDEWLAANPSGNYRDFAMVQTVSDLPKPTPMRVLVEGDLSVCFLGKRFELLPIAEALREYAHRADPAAGLRG